MTAEKQEVKKTEEKSQRQQEIDRIRKMRRPTGVPTPNLDYPARDGYVRRVVCDRPGRLDKFVAGGWSFVGQDDLGEMHSSQLKSTTREGVDSRVSQVVGSHKDGSQMRGYLMELPKELYDEDQAEKMERIDELEAGFRGGVDADGGGRPGKDGRYIPKTGIKIDNKGRR